MMGLHQRRKGGSGEREAAAVLSGVTGIEVKRRIRQHAHDADLDFPGWAVEIKRHAEAPPHAVEAWWLQAQRQADRCRLPALLLYRADRRPWRAVWSPTGDAEHYVEATPATWWHLTGRGVQILAGDRPGTDPAIPFSPGPVSGPEVPKEG